MVVSKTILDEHANPMKYDDNFSRWSLKKKISFLATQNLFQIFFWEIYFQNSTSYLCEVEKCSVFNNYVKLTNVLSGCDKNNFEGSCKPYEVQHHIFFNGLSAKYSFKI